MCRDGEIRQTVYQQRQAFQSVLPDWFSIIGCKLRRGDEKEGPPRARMVMFAISGLEEETMGWEEQGVTEYTVHGRLITAALTFDMRQSILRVKTGTKILGRTQPSSWGKAAL